MKTRGVGVGAGAVAVAVEPAALCTGPPPVALAAPAEAPGAAFGALPAFEGLPPGALARPEPASIVGDVAACVARLFGDAAGWAVELAFSVFDPQPNCVRDNTTAANMLVK